MIVAKNVTYERVLNSNLEVFKYRLDAKKWVAKNVE